MRVFQDVDGLVAALADQVERWISEAVAERGEVHLVLAGGATPRVLHAELATRPMPWAKAHVYFGDERCVAPDDDDSNFRSANESLLSKVPVPTAQVHRIRGEEFEAAVVPYAALLPNRFDIVLLGMGEDGHTASLFPGTESLNATARVLFVDQSPKPPPCRITLGLTAINASRHVAFMVTGRGKADALAKALRQVLGTRGDELPAALVKPVDGTLDFFVDAEAAGRL